MYLVTIVFHYWMSSHFGRIQWLSHSKLEFLWFHFGKLLVRDLTWTPAAVRGKEETTGPELLTT